MCQIISWPGAVTSLGLDKRPSYMTVLKILISPTHHTLDDLILAVVFLHLEKVVAEVEDVKASVLSKEGNDHAASPVEAVSEALPGKQEWQCVNKEAPL